MSNPLEHAMADLRRLDTDIARLQDERARVAGFIEMYGRYAQAGGKPPKHQPSVPRITKKSIVSNAVEGMLLERLAPMPIGAIHDALVDAGIEIGTDKPRQNLSSILNRDARFRSTDKGWWLARAADVANVAISERASVVKFNGETPQRRKGRQRGDISHKWRQILVDAQSDRGTFDANQLHVAAAARGAKLRRRDVHSRMKQYAKLGILEPVGEGGLFRLTETARTKFGSSIGPKNETPAGGSAGVSDGGGGSPQSVDSPRGG